MAGVSRGDEEEDTVCCDGGTKTLAVGVVCGWRWESCDLAVEVSVGEGGLMWDLKLFLKKVWGLKGSFFRGPINAPATTSHVTSMLHVREEKETTTKRRVA